MTYKNIDLPDTEIYLYESKHFKGNKVMSHYHDIYQVLYALDGEGTITIDGVDHEFSKDRMVLCVPNSIHSIQTKLKLTVLVLAFSPESFGSEKLEGIMESFQKESRYFSLDQFTATDIRRLLRIMLFEQSEYDDLYKYAIPSHLINILITLARHQNRNRFRDANEMRSIQIRNYIDRHYFENISAGDLASKFGISTRYMNGLFNGKYDETPLQYLQKVRINRAKQLLVETDKEIVSICFETGYETVSTFYRTFNSLVGLSPNKYRINPYSN